jgi:hypothetical protein
LQTTVIDPVKFIDNNSPSGTNVLHYFLFRQGEIQMKKLFSFVMVLTVLVTVLGFNVGSASAKSSPPPASTPVVVLRSSSFNNLESETVIQVSVDGINTEGVTVVGMTMYCRVDENHNLKCVVPNKFAGQNVIIKISINGTLLNFPVRVPEIQENIPV